MHGKYVARLLAPGELRPRVVLIAGILAMVVVEVLDFWTPREIRLHLLYVFPLAAIALHCERAVAIFAGLVLSVVFQFSTFFFDGIPKGPLATDALVAMASSSLTVILARAVRENYLAAMELATTDWLTGLRNRRSFESIIDSEISRQKRYGGVFSLAVIDLDNFKELNDSAGHHVGDNALRFVADVLREHTRKTDSVARLGGDEFAILLPNTQEADCGSLCKHVSANISKRMAQVTFAVTASIGYATFESAPRSATDALQMADRAMYAAKANGRGRRDTTHVNRIIDNQTYEVGNKKTA
jgi:diguanylate cyclase (GGDEF)-like protein